MAMLSHHDLIQACKMRDVEATRHLLDFFDPSANDNEAIIEASRKGYSDVVKILLSDPRVDPSDGNNFAIRQASCFGHTTVVKLLLADPRVNPSPGDNHTIRSASYHGHSATVKLLLSDPRVDPSVDDNEAILLASLKENRECVKLLLADPRVSPNIQIVQRTFENSNLNVQFFQAAINSAGLKELLPLANLAHDITLDLLDILISRAKGIPSNQTFLHSLRLLKLPIPDRLKMAYSMHLQALFSVSSSSDVIKLVGITIYLANMGIDADLFRLIAQYF